MPIADRYNAFISYRHSKKDNAIAKEIQTSLEHFKIPAKIKKKTGIKRFDRIFRDKEELPITSDLDNEIEAALKVSDYLIVICSTRTSESVWVKREIETFLKYHSKKNIFTVLVDGEPDEVIPDVLLHDTVTRKLADGTIVEQEEIIEPLSCDYRMSIRQARNEELPRLASSMLGCAYDELMRRRRQYRIHRAIAAISATVPWPSRRYFLARAMRQVFKYSIGGKPTILLNRFRSMRSALSIPARLFQFCSLSLERSSNFRMSMSRRYTSFGSVRN